MAQVVPMEDLNLHFTGDFHAITSANNLCAALLDNHIQQGNELGIDTRQIVWKRCLDMNDRVLRNVVVGLGNKMDGFVREDHFVITGASEDYGCFFHVWQKTWRRILKTQTGSYGCLLITMQENLLQQDRFMPQVLWLHF